MRCWRFRDQIDALDRELLALLNRRADAGAAGRRVEEVGRLGGVPARARGAGHRRPEGSTTRGRCWPPAWRRSGARSCRRAARSRRRRASPTSARRAPSASRPRSVSSARRSSACPAPASTRCSAPPPPAPPISASCRSRTPPKAWSPARSTCSCTRRCSSSARPACSCATTCCAASIRSTASRAVLAHPQALAQCHGWLSAHLPQAERRPALSNAEGARLAGADPGAGRDRQRTRRQRVRAARGRAGDPGRRAQPHALCHRHAPAAASGAEGQRARLHQPGRVGDPTGPARCTTCWCR